MFIKTGDVKISKVIEEIPLSKEGLIKPVLTFDQALSKALKEAELKIEEAKKGK